MNSNFYDVLVGDLQDVRISDNRINPDVIHDCPGEGSSDGDCDCDGVDGS